jgi:hypothetical protein
MRQDVKELKDLADRWPANANRIEDLDLQTILKKIVDILDRSLPPDNPDDEQRWS